MKKLIPIFGIGILLLLCTISPVLADAYDYEYTYATTYISFDEHGKAVGITNMHIEPLLLDEVDTITLKIPYDNVTIWYVKEHTKEDILMLSFWREYDYDYSVEPFERTFRGISHNIYHNWEMHSYNLDVDTKVRDGATYVTINLDKPVLASNIKESLIETKEDYVETILDNKTKEFNESGKESDQHEYSVYESGDYITLKYSVHGAIEVGKKKGTLDYSSLTDVNAPIEVLTVGVSAPYGYEFTGKPSFPIASEEEVHDAELGLMADGYVGAEPRAYTEQLSVSKAAITGVNLERSQASAKELQSIVMEEDIEPTTLKPDVFNYVEVRSNIDAGECVSVSGDYKIKGAGPDYTDYISKYWMYVLVFFIVIVVLVGAQSKYKLFW